MKLIVALIKPFKLEEVKDALMDFGVHGMTVTEAKGVGQQMGHEQIYRGSEYTTDLLPKVRIDIALGDAQVGRAVAAIERAARTGKIGDGKIFVLPLEEVVRVRTNERGESAL